MLNRSGSRQDNRPNWTRVSYSNSTDAIDLLLVEQGAQLRHAGLVTGTRDEGGRQMPRHQSVPVEPLAIVEHHLLRSRAARRNALQHLGVDVAMDHLQVVRAMPHEQVLVAAQERRRIETPVVPHQHHPAAWPEDAHELTPRAAAIEPVEGLSCRHEIDAPGGQSRGLGAARDADERGRSPNSRSPASRISVFGSTPNTWLPWSRKSSREQSRAAAHVRDDGLLREIAPASEHLENGDRVAPAVHAHSRLHDRKSGRWGRGRTLEALARCGVGLR